MSLLSRCLALSTLLVGCHASIPFIMMLQNYNIMHADDWLLK